MTFKPKIKKRFQRLQDDLTKEEFAELKESVKREKGNRVAILLMQGDTIVDGHHRYKACVAVKVEPKFEHRVFPGDTLEEQEAAAEEWALREQLGRRNLTRDKFRMAIGRLYNLLKQPHGGNRRSSPQNEDLKKTVEKVAEAKGVSKATVERAAKRAEAVDEQLTEPAKKIVDKLTDAQVQALATKDESKQNEIARAVRTGQKTPAQVLPSRNGSPKKAKPKEVSSAKLVDQLTRKFVSPMVRGIDNIATANGGKGKYHKQANDALNLLIGALKQMRSGQR